MAGVRFESPRDNSGRTPTNFFSSLLRAAKGHGSALDCRRWELLLILVLVLVASFSWCRRLAGPIDLRYDASTYFVLGTSLAEGKGYRLLNEPGEILATQYPPLLPLIIAAHQLAFGTRDLLVVGQWLRLTWFVSYLALSLFVYFTLKRYLPLNYAFIGTLVCLLSLYTYLMSNQLAPEVLFALTTCLFFLSSKCTNPIGSNLFSFLSATASYALRTAGIALFAAWIAESLLQRKFRQAVLRLGLSLVPIVSWQLYIHEVESRRDYISPAYPYQRAPYLFYNVSYAKNIFTLKDSFHPEEGAATAKDIAGRFTANLLRIPGTIGEAMTVERKCWLIPWSNNWSIESRAALTILLDCIGGVVLAGLVLQLVQREWLMPLYVILSMAVICLTPWPIQLVRYFTPLCPFFVVAFFTTARAFARTVRKTAPLRVCCCWSAFLFGSVILVHQSVVYYRFTRFVDVVTYDVPGGRQVRLKVFGYFPAERALNGGIDWLMKQGGTHVIASSAPQWVYLRTSSKAVMPPFEIDADKARALLDSVPVTFLMWEESFTTEYVRNLVHKHPELWREVYSNSDRRFRIYKRVDSMTRT